MIRGLLTTTSHYRGDTCSTSRLGFGCVSNGQLLAIGHRGHFVRAP